MKQSLRRFFMQNVQRYKQNKRVCPLRAHSQVATLARAHFGCLPLSAQTLPSRYLDAHFVILENAFFYADLCRNKHTTCTLLRRKHFVVLKNDQSRDLPGRRSLNLPELKINLLLLHKHKFPIHFKPKSPSTRATGDDEKAGLLIT